MSDLLLSPAVAPAEAPVLYVVFKVDETEYALPSDTVLQMESYQGATTVPGTPAFVAGIVQLRGRVVPVIDVRARFGLPSAEPTLHSRIVVGQHGPRVVALWVDSAREVLRITPSQLKQPPTALGATTGFLKSVAQVGERMVLVMDFARMIGSEEDAVDV